MKYEANSFIKYKKEGESLNSAKADRKKKNSPYFDFETSITPLISYQIKHPGTFQSFQFQTGLIIHSKNRIYYFQRRVW